LKGGILAEQRPSRTPSDQPGDGNAGTDVDDVEEQAKIGARLKEAREYVGLLQEDVASALGIPRASVSALESGKRRVTGLEVRRLARIYRKPVGWLLGEEDIELSESEPLFRAAESLSAQDRDQVLRFAEFLAAAGKPAGSGRVVARSQRSLNRAGDEDNELER
jgi:transcriptional regulator with XRE-family HTH domain